MGASSKWLEIICFRWKADYQQKWTLVGNSVPEESRRLVFARLLEPAL